MAKTPVNRSESGSGEPLDFEQALARLETIVEDLEGGSLSLEDSIARYEEGIRLSRRLTRSLDDAERRIEKLSENGGEVTTEPFELEKHAPDARGGTRGGEGELPF